MKLLYIAPDFHPARGGYSAACTGFVEAISKHSDIDTRVLTYVPLGGARELEVPRISVDRLPTPPWGRAAVIAQQAGLHRHIAHAQRAWGADVILFETAEFPWAGAWASRRYPGQVGVRVHATAETEWVLYRDNYQYRARRAATRRFFREASAIFTTTPYYADFVRVRFLDNNPLLASSKTWGIVPNVLRASDLAPATPRAGDGEIVLFTLGRMDAAGAQQKNFARVIAAIARLAGRPAGDRLRLRVVGSGSMRAALERLAIELGVGKRIEFVSGLSDEDLVRAQRESSAVLLASTYEGLSMFALESLGRGAALLVSDVGGLRDLVDDGENGYRFDPLDVADIADKIETFAESMLPRLAQARAASIRKFERQFRSERTIATFVAGLKEMRGQARASP